MEGSILNDLGFDRIGNSYLDFNGCDNIVPD